MSKRRTLVLYNLILQSTVRCKAQTIRLGSLSSIQIQAQQVDQQPQKTNKILLLLLLLIDVLSYKNAVDMQLLAPIQLCVRKLATTARMSVCCPNVQVSNFDAH